MHLSAAPPGISRDTGMGGRGDDVYSVERGVCLLMSPCTSAFSSGDGSASSEPTLNPLTGELRPGEAVRKEMNMSALEWGQLSHRLVLMIWSQSQPGNQRLVMWPRGAIRPRTQTKTKTNHRALWGGSQYANARTL